MSGAAILDDIVAFIGRYIVLPSPAAADAMALWAAHTHAMDAWDNTPRIGFISPEPGSGKTRCLEVLGLFCPRAHIVSNCSVAYIIREISSEDGLPTFLLDEADAIFGNKTPGSEDLRAILNSGYARDAFAGRVEVDGKNFRPVKFPSYSAVALAGLKSLPETIATRAIVVRMRARAPSEHVDRFRKRHIADEADALRDRLADWMNLAFPDRLRVWPDVPDVISDRAADVWESLFAVADAAGGNWPVRARQAAIEFTTAATDERASLGIQLLRDLRSVFDGEPRMTTDDILQGLRAMDEAPWGDLHGKALDARKLARMLKSFGVKSRNMRLDSYSEGKVLKGYDAADLADPWARCVTPWESVTSATSATSAGGVAAGGNILPHNNKYVADVADVADAQGVGEEVAQDVADVAPFDEADFNPGFDE